MARSSYIYIVMEGNSLRAAFTVKHECQTWLERNPAPKQTASTRWVRRMYDGGGDPVAGKRYLTEQEFLDG